MKIIQYFKSNVLSFYMNGEFYHKFKHNFSLVVSSIGRDTILRSVLK